MMMCKEAVSTTTTTAATAAIRWWCGGVITEIFIGRNVLCIIIMNSYDSAELVVADDNDEQHAQKNEYSFISETFCS